MYRCCGNGDWSCLMIQLNVQWKSYHVNVEVVFHFNTAQVEEACERLERLYIPNPRLGIGSGVNDYSIFIEAF